MSDIDPVMLRNLMRTLHSTTESAESIRLCLDEAIRQRYGNTRPTLTEQLSERQLAEEKLAGAGGLPWPPVPSPSVAGSSRSQNSRASSLAKESTVRQPTAPLDSGTEAEASGGADEVADGSELVVAVPDDDAEKGILISDEDHMEVSVLVMAAALSVHS